MSGHDGVGETHVADVRADEQVTSHIACAAELLGGVDKLWDLPGALERHP